MSHLRATVRNKRHRIGELGRLLVEAESWVAYHGDGEIEAVSVRVLRVRHDSIGPNWHPAARLLASTIHLIERRIKTQIRKLHMKGRYNVEHD